MNFELSLLGASEVIAKNDLDRCSIFVPIGQMGFDKVTLTIKALLVVHEAAEQAARGTVKMTVGLRFALAYLYTTGQSKDPTLFKRFAQSIAEPHKAQVENFGNYMRSIEARGCRGAIMRNAGIEASPDNESRLNKAYERLARPPLAKDDDGKPRIP